MMSWKNKIISDKYSFFFFKQKTAYDMRISDWSSDVCSSDLIIPRGDAAHHPPGDAARHPSVTQASSLRAASPRIETNGIRLDRSEERREGKEFVSSCRSRWSSYH